MRFSCSSLVLKYFFVCGLLGASLVAVAQSGDGIVVYNAQHASLTQAWADGFTRETGIMVTLRKGGDAELGNQIVQEGKASTADVFLTENSPAMALVDSAGLFAPVDAATLAQVPLTFARPMAVGLTWQREAPCSFITSVSSQRPSCLSR